MPSKYVLEYVRDGVITRHVDGDNRRRDALRVARDLATSLPVVGNVFGKPHGWMIRVREYKTDLIVASFELHRSDYTGKKFVKAL